MTGTAVESAIQESDLHPTSDPFVTRILQRYPTTCFMIVPYVVLIVPQAVLYGNPRTLFLLYLVMLGILGAGAIETLFLLLRPPYRLFSQRRAANSRYTRILRVARPVAVVGLVADVISAAAGGGAIDTQVTGQAASSPLVPLMTPLGGWKYMALGLFVSAHLGGLMTKKSFYRWVALMMCAQVVVAVFTAITAPIVNFFSFVALACLVLGMVRVRLVLVFAVGLLLAWPTIFQVRNEIRESKGVAVSAEVTAQERLRFDEQVSNVASYEVPAKLTDLIGPGDIIRYGLVPRVLDSSRPILSTGNVVSEYVGGARTNSYSFLPLGNLYFFAGPYGVVLFYGSWALALVLLLRTGEGPGPGRLMILSVAIAGPLSWTNSYPESLVGFLQSLVGMIPVMLAVRMFGKDSRTPALRRRIGRFIGKSV